MTTHSGLHHGGSVPESCSLYVVLPVSLSLSFSQFPSVLFSLVSLLLFLCLHLPPSLPPPDKFLWSSTNELTEVYIVVLLQSPVHQADL